MSEYTKGIILYNEKMKNKTNKKYAIKPPAALKKIASFPLPFLSSLCPGIADNAVSLEGIPKTSEGIKSRKLWAIAIEQINTAKRTGSKAEELKTERIITAIRLM